MAVEKHGGLTRSLQRFGVHQGMQGGGHDFNRLKSSSTEIIGDPFCGALHIGLVFALGADTGNAQEGTEFRQVLFAAVLDKFSKVHLSLRTQECSESFFKNILKRINWAKGDDRRDRKNPM